MKTDAVVIGAGLSGLTLALQLKQKNPDAAITILEKNNSPGGLLSSFHFAGHWLDCGTFFFNNEFTPNLIDTYPELFSPALHTRHIVWYNTRFGDFPIDLRGIFSHFTFKEWIGFIITFGFIVLRRAWIPQYYQKPARHAAEWLTQRLTAQVYRYSGLSEYIRKIEGCDPDQVSYLFGQDRLYRLNEYIKPSEIFKLMVNKISPCKIKGKYDTLTVKYPTQGGVGAVCDRIVHDLKALGVRLHYNAQITAINRIASGYQVQLDHDIINTSCLISTMPITDFFRLLSAGFENKPSFAVEYRHLLLVYFLINKSCVLKDTPVIYSYVHNHKWKRLVSFTSINPHSSPPGQSSICLEVPFTDPAEIEDRQALTTELLENLTREMNLFNTSDVIQSTSCVAENAYPVFKNNCHLELQKALSYVIQFNRLFTTGRLGSFNQDNTSDCLAKAYTIAEYIDKSSP